MNYGGHTGAQEEADFELGLIWDEHQESFDLFLRFTLGLHEDKIKAPREAVRVDLERLRALRRDPAAYADELTNSLFAHDDLKQFYREAMASLPANVPVHLRLHLDAPDVFHSILWELLRDPDHAESPLATSPRILMSRYLLSNEWRPVQEVPDADLKALAVIAAPTDLAKFKLPGRTLSDVDRDTEVEIADAALEKYAPRFLSDPGHATCSSHRQC